jgi:hypothetical protein
MEGRNEGLCAKEASKIVVELPVRLRKAHASRLVEVISLRLLSV